MIETNRDLNLFEVSCDRCSSENAEIDCDYGWHTMIQELKDGGWRISQDGNGEWQHIGPACVEAEREDPFR